MKHVALLAAFALVISSMQGCGDRPAGVPKEARDKPRIDIVCSLAPSQNKVMNRISGAADGATVTAYALAQATGLTVVAHSSGAYILTGAGGYVAGTLGGAIAGPIIVGVSLVVGGTAVTVELLCASENHPVEVARIREAS